MRYFSGYPKRLATHGMSGREDVTAAKPVRIREGQ